MGEERSTTDLYYEELLEAVSSPNLDDTSGLHDDDIRDYASSVRRISAILDIAGEKKHDIPLARSGDCVGTYCIEAVIRKGKFSNVYSAKSTLDNNRRVVLKQAAVREVAENEFQVTNLLCHPFVQVCCEMLEAPVDGNDFTFLVFPYYGSETLIDYASHADEVESLEALVSVCSAISYLHSRGIIHCDINPTNICVRPCGSPCIVDFHSSRIATTSRDLHVTKEYFPSSLQYVPRELIDAHVSSDVDHFGLKKTVLEVVSSIRPSYRRGYKKVLNKLSNLVYAAKSIEAIETSLIQAIDELNKAKPRFCSKPSRWFVLLVCIVVLEGFAHLGDGGVVGELKSSVKPSMSAREFELVAALLTREKMHTELARLSQDRNQMIPGELQTVKRWLQGEVSSMLQGKENIQPDPAIILWESYRDRCSPEVLVDVSLLCQHCATKAAAHRKLSSIAHDSYQTARAKGISFLFKRMRTFQIKSAVAQNRLDETEFHFLSDDELASRQTTISLTEND